MEKFDLSQIKAGYLLVVERTKTGEKFNMTVVDADLGAMCGLACCSPGVASRHYWPLCRFDANTLSYWGDDIVAVYGLTHPKFLLDNSTEHRELLWERKEPKKMTVAEICKALGYDVEIVKEGEA